MRRFSHSRKSKTAVPVAKDRRLVVHKSAGPGEDVRIGMTDVAHPFAVADLKAGLIRLFDPAADDRGPEVPVIITWGNESKTWFPKTEGIYVVEFIRGRPEEFRHWSLGMGDCSGPQYTLASIHRVWLNITEKHPALTAHIRIVKRPCVMCKDHPDAPGGSFVVIDLATLPPACEQKKLSVWYG